MDVELNINIELNVHLCLHIDIEYIAIEVIDIYLGILVIVDWEYRPLQGHCLFSALRFPPRPKKGCYIDVGSPVGDQQFMKTARVNPLAFLVEAFGG
jgi:hypothetical protein